MNQQYIVLRIVLAQNISLRWQLSGTTVAGVWNSPGINSSKFNAPFRVILDSSNTLYISNYANHRVQKWLLNEASGTTVAGDANVVTSTALNHLNFPCGLCY